MDLFLYPVGPVGPEGGYRNTFRPCVRACVRPASDLRDGWLDLSEILGHHQVPCTDDARLFGISKNSKMAAWLKK